MTWKYAATQRAWYRNNREHALAKSKAWRLANPERHRELQRVWKEKNPEKAKTYRITARWRRMGVVGGTPETFEALLAAQGGLCAICQQPPATGKKLGLDHDHSCGEVRGLLCTSCNQSLGWLEKFDRQVEWVKQARTYLKSNRSVKRPLHFRGTKGKSNRDVAQLDSASGSDPEGSRFES